jgi:outer membrane protein W
MIMSARARSGAALVAVIGWMFSPFEAHAQEAPGLYANVYLGPSRLSSTGLTESRPAGGRIGDNAKFDGGIGFGGAVGYRYGNGWAAEVAWDYRRHGLKSVGGTPVDGDYASNTLFVNGYYRLPKWGAIRPFIGAGLGWTQEIDIDIERNGRELSYSRSGGVAFQAILGGEFELSSRWSLVGDVRWMRVGSRDFKAEGAAADGTLTGQLKYQPISLNLGLTYRF